MITFKTFLQEKALNHAVYQKTFSRLGDKALIGFEIEMLVTDGSDVYVEDDSEARQPFESIERYDTFDEFKSSFNMSRYDERDIEAKFSTYVEEQVNDWVDENWERFSEDGELIEKDARSDAKAEIERKYKNLSWTELFHKQFNGPYEFIRHFGLEPRFGWRTEDKNRSTVYTEEVERNNWFSTAVETASKLSKLLNTDVKVNEHNNRDYSHWKIVPDGSIVPNESKHEVGLELVSPPLPANEALIELKKIFEFIGKHNIDTTSRTGLHVNISIPNIGELDKLKLVLFMGDEHVLNQFGRLKNVYSSPQMQSIIDGIQATGEVPRSGHELLDLAKKSLSNTKNRSVNLSRLENGYLEFRALGGENYHLRYEQVIDVIGRWLTVVELAANPDEERQEYMKKVAKLLGRTWKEEHRTDELDLEQLVKNIDPMLWNRLHSDKEDHMQVMLNLAIELGHKTVFVPSFKQIKELRSMMKGLGITYDDLKNASADRKQPFRVSGVTVTAPYLAVKRFGEMFKLGKS